jgi:hypothetical protein
MRATRRRPRLAHFAARSRVGLLAPVALAACVTIVEAPAQWSSASPDPGVINLHPATFAPGSGVREEVLAECGVERDIPERIARWSPVPVVLAEPSSGGARVLELEVRHIFAPGGGPLSGPKSMTVHGELTEAREGGRVVVGSFDVRRTTTRGTGTCEMLDIVADAIAKDVRRWLAHPSLNAPLGEL